MSCSSGADGEATLIVSPGNCWLSSCGHNYVKNLGFRLYIIPKLNSNFLSCVFFQKKLFFNLMSCSSGGDRQATPIVSTGNCWMSSCGHNSVRSLGFRFYILPELNSNFMSCIFFGKKLPFTLMSCPSGADGEATLVVSTAWKRLTVKLWSQFCEKLQF